MRQGEKRDGTNAKGKKKEKKNQQSSKEIAYTERYRVLNDRSSNDSIF